MNLERQSVPMLSRLKSLELLTIGVFRKTLGFCKAIARLLDIYDPKEGLRGLRF